MQYWVINTNNELITTSNVPCSVEWLQSVEVPDNITCGYILTDKWEWEKWENLIKEEKIQEFKNLKQQIIDEENNEKIKQILWIETKPTKSWESNLDALKTQINNLYNDLIKTYWEDITNLLF